MRNIYIEVTLVAAAAFAYAAFLSLTGNKSIVAVAERLGVPVAWMTRLGLLLAAGSLGLLAGFAWPALGTAAAGGLVLYFFGAAGAHIRARDTLLTSWLNWLMFFSLAVAALVVQLACHGAM